MPKKASKRIKPVINTATRDKKFKRLIPSKKKVRISKVTETEVLIDLRRGVLKSLDRYLAQEGGITDRHIAVELRKLISGSQCRSDYRIVTTHHPDAVKAGGRPSKKHLHMTELEALAASIYEEYSSKGDKNYIAIENTMETLGISEATVKRSVRKSQKINENQDYTDTLIHRRNAALEKMKASE